MEQLAQALRAKMEERDHSIRQAAAAMKVASGTVVNWSEAWVKKAPRHVHWRTLADYLEVPMPVLLEWLGLLTPEQATRATGVYVTSSLSTVAA